MIVLSGPRLTTVGSVKSPVVFGTVKTRLPQKVSWVKVRWVLAARGLRLPMSGRSLDVSPMDKVCDLGNFDSSWRGSTF